MLESIGLGERDRDVYRALLLHPNWNILDIQRNLDLSKDDVSVALDCLTELALLRCNSGSQPFITTSPELSLLPKLQGIEADELDERRAGLSREQAALATLTSEYTSLRVQSGAEGLERVEGVEAVRIRLQELSEQATSEVRAFMPGRALSEAALEVSRPLHRQNLARGVRVQMLCLDTVQQVPMMEYTAWLASEGGQMRTVPSLPTRLIIYDRATAVIPVYSDASREEAFVIRVGSIVTAFNALFDLAWERATPLGGTPTPHSDGPSERDLALLRNLAEGLTDEVIGRRLGVSIRTVRRLMADLLKRLNAQSRFQAGAEAVRLGWI
ncbi:helix-turn-helix domain-containing protein [Streptomyces sp. SID12488]|uniref:helix-turn-helix domain-containing protein n=1 Tax=Streptomyces sp. SID12488 TaxID=2706040 RepID=UPI0013DC6635|nr:helix-turn-helix domain-containing protein [Streptomyces sp. SID12488]NEA66995.1 helix-turn-helix domain-containing protein [Streptomyces sp. SID12488]